MQKKNSIMFHHYHTVSSYHIIHHTSYIIRINESRFKKKIAQKEKIGEKSISTIILHNLHQCYASMCYLSIHQNQTSGFSLRTTTLSLGLVKSRSSFHCDPLLRNGQLLCSPFGQRPSP